MSSADVEERLRQGLGSAYAIERELGGGGMSRVFVADEAALGRKVVVKVLRPELAEELSAERFKREVKLAARLQHPHIVPLLATGELDGGVLYYTMPFVEGESLRARVAREGGLPIEEVVRITRDVAGALAHAHRQGVAHRDIKPENILLSDGGATVADFGIAKAISASLREDDSGEPHRSSTLTAAGTSLGTPAYMAPEQAAGDAVDHRADLYSLGVVCYEMLAGRAPFERKSAQQLLAAHATETPDLVSRHRPTVPPALGALVMRLLEKHPGDRPRSADEVMRTLDLMTDARLTGPAPLSPRRALRVPSWVLIAAAAVIAGVLIGGAIARRSVLPDERGRRPVIALLTAPPGQELRADGGFALSPDGARLAFVASDQSGATALWIRPLDSLGAVRVEGTDGGSAPFWSPDGASLGYFAGGQLRVAELRGGARRALCPAPRPGGGTWTTRGVIVYAPDFLAAPLYRVASSGGECAPLMPLTPGEFERRAFPSALPDGRHVLFTLGRGTSGAATFVLDLESGAQSEVRRPALDAQFAPPHWILYREGTAHPLFAQRLDLATMKPAGEARALFERVSSYRAVPSFTASERAVVALQPASGAQSLVWVDARSAIVDSVSAPVEIGTLFGGVGASMSSDGRRIALGGQSLWLHDRDRNVTTRVRAEAMAGQGILDPAWGPGDSLIAYSTIFRGPLMLRVYRVATGTSDSLFAIGQRNLRTPDWSPDGKRIAFQLSAGDTAQFDQIWIYSMPERRAYRAWETSANLASPRWSPDGRWLAYVSEESGAPAVYVRALTGGAAVRVSPAGGDLPQWSSDGRELYYRAPNGAIMGVGVALGDQVSLTRPRVVVADPPFSRAIRGFEVTADGQQFVALGRGDPQALTLLLDWSARLTPP
jgi:serine/threonine protein kinase